MELKKDRLPNLFDQYEVEENRVTNALLQTLAISPGIVEGFLNHFIRGISIGEIAFIELSEQGVPKKNGTDAPEVKETRESVPDGWLILRRKDNNVAYVVVIESKIKKNSATRRQLLRHLVKARRKFQPYKDVWALLITPDNDDPFPGWRPEEGLYIWTNWRDIHAFADNEKKLNTDSTAQILIENFMEFIEMNELAGFQGIDFSEGYDKEKARRILRTLMQDIKEEVLKMYPNLRKQKGNISDPWDVFAPEDVEKFNQGIHFTLGIDERSLDLLLTVPDKCMQGWDRLKSIMTSERAKLEPLLSELRQKLPNLILVFQQRHFIAQRIPFMDGQVQVDLDTTEFVRKKEDHTKVRKNRQLFELFVSAVKDAPRSINKEVNFITKFYYNDQKYKDDIKQAEFCKTAISVLAAFRQLYDYLTE
jgi:hypothetical protein